MVEDIAYFCRPREHRVIKIVSRRTAAFRLIVGCAAGIDLLPPCLPIGPDLIYKGVMQEEYWIVRDVERTIDPLTGLPFLVH